MQIVRLCATVHDEADHSIVVLCDNHGGVLLGVFIVLDVVVSAACRPEGRRVCVHSGPRKNAIAKILSLCVVSVRATELGLMVDEEAGDVVKRTALGWILASQKKWFPPGMVGN